MSVRLPHSVARVVCSEHARITLLAVAIAALIGLIATLLAPSAQAQTLARLEPLLVPAAGGANSGSVTLTPLRGGRLTVGRYTLVVPPGALRERATITLVQPDPTRLECDLSIVPASANGFRLPLLLVADAAGGRLLGTAATYWFNPASGGWERQATTVNLAGAQVSTPLAHFSRYAVSNSGKSGW